MASPIPQSVKGRKQRVLAAMGQWNHLGRVPLFESLSRAALLAMLGGRDATLKVLRL